MYGGTFADPAALPGERAQKPDIVRARPILLRRLNCQKILAGGRQYLTATGRDRYHILDPHAPFAGEVYPGSIVMTIPGCRISRWPLATRGAFVNLQPHPMPGGMREKST